jgi:hypothetical protein
MDRPPLNVGDIIEWMKCPVVIIGRPFKGGDGKWYAPAAYLRQHQGRPFEYPPGKICQRFMIGGDKQPFTGTLTDEEQALAMRLVLIGE